MRAAPTPSNTRITVVGVVAFLWLLLLLARLVDLQVLQHADLAARALRQQQRVLEVTPKRGVIYDRQGNELAVSIGVDSVFAVPADLSDPARTAQELAPVLSLDATELENRLRSSRSFVWIKRKLDAAEAERVRRLKLPGIYFQREFKRFYPKRELAAHVLGFVGIDENGLGGIEYALDSVIRGRPRRLVITNDGRRRTFEREGDAPAEGASVALTLDENVQYIAEQELAAAIERTHARQGTVIVENPHTGEILALANYPTFNPNDPTAVPASWRVDPAVSLAYEPGSTFKMVTVTAALEEGLTHPDEVIDCQMGSIQIAGHTIHDHKPFGLLSVRQVIQESSDIGAIKIGLRLGDDRMYQHIHKWHFGEPTGIELPAESPGLLRPPDRWSRISIGAISMGQEVAITSLQLATAISAVANGGVWIQPHVVDKIIRGDESEPLATPRTDRILPVEVNDELRQMLGLVVAQGTGRAAQPAGYSAAGKTGTAQKIDASGRYSRTNFIASFAGFAPASSPAVAVVVVLDSPRGPRFHGGDVAAPVFRNVTQRVLAYLNIPRDMALPPASTAPPLDRAAVEDLQPDQFGDAADPVDLPPGTPRAVLARDTTRRPSLPGEAVLVPSSGPSDPATPGTSIVLDNADTVVVPNLVGLSLRAVGERCAPLGLEPVLVGSGLAAVQKPPAGTRVPRGSRVWVEFRRSLPEAPARPM